MSSATSVKMYQKYYNAPYFCDNNIPTLVPGIKETINCY